MISRILFSLLVTHAHLVAQLAVLSAKSYLILMRESRCGVDVAHAVVVLVDSQLIASARLEPSECLGRLERLPIDLNRRGVTDRVCGFAAANHIDGPLLRAGVLLGADGRISVIPGHVARIYRYAEHAECDDQDDADAKGCCGLVVHGVLLEFHLAHASKQAWT